MPFTTETSGRNPVKAFGPRLMLGMWLVGLAFIVLLGRLYNLQILRGEELSSQGQRNFVQRVRIPHDRGIIFDRYGRILVDNRPALDVQVTPAFLGKKDQARATLERLAGHLGLTIEDVDRIAAQVSRKRGGLARFQPVVVKRDLQAEEVEAIESDRSVFLLDGVDIVEGRRRSYRYGSLAAHLLGYVNEIDGPGLEAERAKGNPLSYELGDLIGREGIERTHENDLRGVDGYEQIVVDAKGRKQQDVFMQALLGENRRVEPKPGRNIYLSLDLELQQAAETAFAKMGVAGSVVAIDPTTGGVLAMVSAPEFDPNAASGALGPDEKAKLDLDPLKPWLNRPIQGQYAPGSTFKVSTGIAALLERAGTTTEKVFCPGYYRLGRYTWRCHKDAGHGYVDLKEALKVSCDTWFYTMAGRMGIEPIARASRSLGLGSISGIAMRGERSGLVPDEAYHNRVDKASGGFQKGMAINTSIGQGALLVTPLQLVYAYAVLANGGVLYAPRLVERIESADFRVTRRVLQPVGQGPRVREEVQGAEPALVTAYQPVVRSRLEVPASVLEAIRSGLNAVVDEPGGTAYSKRSLKVSMAGKTGTAQVVRLGRERLKEHEMDYWHRDHAWFVAWAPAENPEIAIVTLNEHSGHGGAKAAPVVTEVIDAYVMLRERRAARASDLTSAVQK